MVSKKDNYSASIEVTASTEACFNAIAREMDKWWTETTAGQLNKIGDTIKAVFPPDYGHWTFEATRLNPDKMIEMVCINAHHQVDGQPKEIDQEWMNTRIVWEFIPEGDKTRVTMTHVGLTPKLKCWDICFDGWNYFFKESLRAYLNGEAPSPHKA
ncbi:MAG: SRPBCC domain-containing protein [Rhodobacteraceae bacterium]|nr:SRPBCC domain-containing protein [Paracoccaceae bacterium]